MYFHVYADLVMLSKSRDLGKSVMDMNQHYLELHAFLEKVENNPEVVMDKSYRVFTSEEELYGSNKKINHRCSSKCEVIHEKLFAIIPDESSILYPLLASGAAKMKDKLCTYAGKQLPGGEYWNPHPDSAVKCVLERLQPSNDFCESILGLNDYLTTAIPNLTQAARSNLVEIKKNHTMRWLCKLPNEKQVEVLDLAVKERPRVVEEHRKLEEYRSQQRKQAMLKANVRREALRRKAHQERDELLQHHLITTSTELHETLQVIDTESISAQRKKSKKISVLKTQIRIRKKVLGQDIRIVFSHARKQRPLHELVKELSEYIDKNTLYSEYIQDPSILVGKSIQHRFETDDSTVWYNGFVVGYIPSSKTHEIKYEGEEEHCKFDLILDLLNGDLKVI